MPEVSDPDILQQLNGGSSGEVTDPDLLRQLNGGGDEDEPSPVGSFAREGAHSLGAGIGAGLGMVGGAALGTLAAPVTGGLSVPAGAIAGGAAGGMAGQAMEDWALNKLGLAQGTGQLSNIQRQKDIETNPLSSFSGGLAGSIGAGFGVGAGARVGARAIGAGIQGLLEGGQEAYRGEDLDPAKIGLAAGAGALFAKPRGWVTNLEGRLGNAAAGSTEAPVRPPDAKPDLPVQEPEFSGEATVSAEAQTAEDKAEVEATGSGKKSAPSTTSISQGTATEQPPITDKYAGQPKGQGAMLENEALGGPNGLKDALKSARGEATQPNTLLSTNAIHPDIAATFESEPKQSPGHAQPLPQRGAQTSVTINGRNATAAGPDPQQTAQMAIQAAKEDAGLLPPVNPPPDTAGLAPPQGQPHPAEAFFGAVRQAAGKPEFAQAIKDAHPDLTGPQLSLVMRAIQQAERRPIIETPMPSGANSARDLNGPVFVNNGTPPELWAPVAIHETVEGALEKVFGKVYDNAHPVAQTAERLAVEAAGGNWGEYQKAWKEPLARAAALPRDTVLPKVPLASDPFADIGHYHVPSPDEGVAQGPETTAQPEHIETGLAPKEPDTGIPSFLKRNPDNTLANKGRVLDKNSPEFKAAAEAALQSETGRAPIVPKETPAAEEGPKGTIDNGGLMAMKRSEMPKESLDDATERVKEAISKKAGFPPATEEAIKKSKASTAADDLKAGIAPQRTRDTVEGWLKDNPVTRLFSPTSMGEGAKAAAGIIREANGINARQIAIASNRMEPMRALVNALPEQARVDFMKAVDTGKKVDYLPQLQPLAETMRSTFATIKTELQNLHGLEKQEFVENFFPHMFKRDTADDAIAADTFAKSWFSKQGSTASLHHRKFPTLQDGLNAGLKLASTDPVDVTMRYMGSMRNFIEAKNILQAGKDQGFIKTFKNSRMGASGNPEGDKIPFGYVALKGRGSTGPEGSLYAPADFAEIYNNYLDQGFHSTETGARLYNALQNTSNAVTALELGFSGYHAFTMAKEAIIHQVAEGLSRAMSGDVAGGLAKIGKAPAAPYTLAKAGADPLKAYLDPGANVSPELRKTVDLITRSGGRMQGFRQDPTYKFSEMGSFFTAWKRGALAQQLADAKDRIQTEWTGRANTLGGVANTGLQTGKELFRTVGRAMQTVAQPTFEHYIPALKNGAFTETLGEWLRNNPDATDAEQVAMARKIGDSVDNRFGEMVQSNIFWKAQLKQSMQLAMRSYSWNLGTVREIGGGAASLASSNPLKRLNMKSNDYDPRAAYVVAMPIVVAAASSVYQFLKTGEMPKDTTDLLAGRTGGKTQSGTPERAMLPGYEKDVYGWFHDPKQEAINKIATAPRLVWETLANKDYAGHDIADPRDPLAKRLKDYGAHVYNSLGPISLKQMTQGEKKGSNITFPERATAIRPAPPWLQEPERIQHGADAAAKREMAAKKKFEQHQQNLYK
jgi:hypothetical protein